MEKVVIAEDAPSFSISEARLICRVCQKQFSQYTCPRCNTRYCSLECYKGHSLRCTESFMRENVTKELRQIQSSDETKREMLEILKRVYSKDEMDSDNEEGSMLSEDTIRKILSGDEIGPEDLSPEELKKFRRAVTNGELSKLIEPWDPWWKKPSARSISLGPEGNQLVSLLREDEHAECFPSTSDASFFCEVPAGPENPLPPVHQLSLADPSPLLSVHLIDIMYAYCFTLRLYNGDWHFDPLGATMVVLTISSVLGSDHRPETVSQVLAFCMEQTCSPSFRHTGGFKFGLIILEDLVSLLSLGADPIICLLCDLRRLIHSAGETLRSEHMLKANRVESSRKLKGVDRKVYFLACWVHEQPEAAWSALAGILEAEKVSVSASGQGGAKHMEGDGRVSSKPIMLIEEVQGI